MTPWVLAAPVPVDAHSHGPCSTTQDKIDPQNKGATERSLQPSTILQLVALTVGTQGKHTAVFVHAHSPIGKF